MNPSSPSPARPLIPRLLLAGLLVLTLSWLAFMTHYVRKVSHRPRGEAPPTLLLPAAAVTNPPSPPPAAP